MLSFSLYDLFLDLITVGILTVALIVSHLITKLRKVVTSHARK